MALVLAVSVVFVAAVVDVQELRLWLSRLARDLSRAKSRARLHGRPGALALVSEFKILKAQDAEEDQNEIEYDLDFHDYKYAYGNEETLESSGIVNNLYAKTGSTGLKSFEPDVDQNLKYSKRQRQNSFAETENAAPTMAAEELATFDGSVPGTPLYLSIMGRIFDVSAAPEYYARGRSYNHLVGRDATRAFVTGCSAPACLVPSLAGLRPSLHREARRWLDMYRFHDRYKFVAMLAQDVVETALENAQAEELVLLTANGERMHTKEMVRNGILEYRRGDLERAKVLWRAALVITGEDDVDGASLELNQREELRAKALNLLGAAAHKERHFEDAIEHFAEALDILAKVLHPKAYKESPLVANIAADLGATYFVAGKPYIASQHLRLAVNILENRKDFETLFSKAMLTANTRTNLARALAAAKDEAQAIQELNQVITAAKSALQNLDLDQKQKMALDAVVISAQSGLAKLQREASI